MPVTIHQDVTEQDQASSLRVELKEWERAFSVANGGRKPGRDDIKLNPAISEKYKIYSRIRSQSSKSSHIRTEENGEQNESLQNRHRKRKRLSNTEGKEGERSYSTPRKAPKQILATPSKGSSSLPTSHPSQLDPYDSPSTLRRLFSPSNHQGPHSSSPLPLRAAIGPTPQRNGKALGLFDLLSSSGGSSRGGAIAATPCSKRKTYNQEDNVFQTPTRQRGQFNVVDLNEDNDDDERYARVKTPASSAKKFYLANFFATPPAYRYTNPANEHDDGNLPNISHNTKGNGQSPRSTGVGSDTPSFLRRRGLFSSINSRQNARAGKLHDLSPVAVRMPQKLVGKGLSAIVKGLRDIQEERLDDDLDVLRELEAEQAGQHDNVIVSDSQFKNGDGDGDNENKGGYGDGDAPDNPKAETRQWKKMGQKRNTRRVILRPVRAKLQAAPEVPAAAIDGESDNELAAVLETQRNIPPPELGDKGADSDPDFNSATDLDSDSNYEENAELASPSRTRKSKPLPNHSMAKGKQATTEATAITAAANTAPGTAAAKSKKPIKPEAHANYRALKIRGKGSGPKRSFGGRFPGRFGGRR
ncbi:hypothetical protein ACO22_02813 [Paracoccidioides brasiliensis]|uniref:DNA replication regulator SLD2 n=1 Tax=Paracoccidioides brasiliensis TaxID=121759 RepID=A0A1D2JHQ5_PARBR|nr:hypothetical protein ACO22_02813 [Paracoccidioides brasiliensis]